MNERILELESSQLFAKQAYKTQVLITCSPHIDIFRNRQTHAYEVRTVSEIIAKNIRFDKIPELSYVAMTHDCGHPPFGHAGATAIDKAFKDAGLMEGFSDNNNNIDMLTLNGLSVSDYELVSLIKYPGKLYPYQKKQYLKLLTEVLSEERKDWGDRLNRTVACNIMDIADEISYTTSDLYDSYSTGYTKDLMPEFFAGLAQKYKSDPSLYSVLTSISNSSKEEYKRALRSDIFRLKMLLIKNVYWDYDHANLRFRDKPHRDLMQEIFSFTFKNFIHSAKVGAERDLAVQKLNSVIDFFLNCTPDKFPSDMYREKYLSENTKEGRLRAIRNMVSDMTDLYVLNFKES